MTDRMSGDLRLEQLSKEFDDFTAVHPLDLTIPDNSFFALLGPSGCGKTTTLRMIAGLEDPTSGRILIGDQDITEVKAFKRNVNTVFQSYALFPHMKIIDNVAFGLKRRGDKEAMAKAQEALDLVQLGHTSKKRPTQLSGGMQQRVALARALVNRPDVLLLDEPLGALDLKLRRQMQIELKKIQAEVGITFIHVTHDQEEAMTMADTVAVMSAGRLEQVGSPAELYDHPRSTFVANFLGQSNLLTSRITGEAGEGLVTADTHGHEILVAKDRVPEGVTEVFVGVRPEKLRLGRSGRNQLTATVTDASFTGAATQYLVRLPWGFEVTLVQANDGSPRASVGEEVPVSWEPGSEFVLDANQDEDAGLLDTGLQAG
jgi:spermidine/putrescine transport system ATP-binding protein